LVKLLEEENETLQSHLEEFEIERSQLKKKYDDYKQKINNLEHEKQEI